MLDTFCRPLYPPAMPLSYLVYRSLVGALRLASPAFSRGNSKLARGVRGRRRAAERLRAWAAAHRDPGRPLVWMHAPSVGEGLQAAAVLAALKARDDSVQSVFTHFSPSAETLASRVGADVSDYLPWDVVDETGSVLTALNPTVLAFTKTEVWPTLAAEADQRGCRLALIAATLPESSSRLSPLARPLLRGAFARLHAVHAISDEDGKRFERLGVHPTRVSVTGDPAVDSAAQRIASADPNARYLRIFRGARPRVVAGSTWPADHRVLLPACVRIRKEIPTLQLVVAPHEPTEAHVSSILLALRGAGWRVAKLAEVESVGTTDAVDAVVVDRVGVLAHLYTVASAAYVGGGFHDQGLHSVLEPAAAGIPTCFGPRHANSLAAEDLIRRGAARAVEGEGALAQMLAHWLKDGDSQGAAGRAAAEYVRGHRGAADRSAQQLWALLGP